MNAVVPLHPGRDAAEPRKPPVSLEAEQAVLGAILVNNDAFGHLSGILSAEHFGEELHRRIFELMASLINGGKAASIVSLKTFLGDHDLGGLTIGQYLARLVSEAATVILAVDYAGMIRDLAHRRMLIAAGQEVIDHAHDLPVGAEPAKLVTAFQEAAAPVMEIAAESTRAVAGESALKLVRMVTDMKNGDAKAEGIPTGLADLDRVTGGYEPGTLWILAARPGMGKTVKAVSSAVAVTRKGHGALLFSLEVPEKQMMSRILASMAYLRRKPLQFSRIFRGDIGDDELWMIEDAAKRLGSMPLILDCATGLSVSDIAHRVRREQKAMAARGVKLGVVFIDYLKFITAGERYRGNRVYEVGEISGALKQLAKATGVCIVLLAQLNRGVEAREDKRPTLADLRDSGDLEADADVVVFLYRRAYYLEKTAKAAKGAAADEALVEMTNCQFDAELIVDKNRAGPTTTVHVFADVGCSIMSAEARA